MCYFHKSMGLKSPVLQAAHVKFNIVLTSLFVTSFACVSGQDTVH